MLHRAAGEQNDIDDLCQSACTRVRRFTHSRTTGVAHHRRKVRQYLFGCMRLSLGGVRRTALQPVARCAVPLLDFDV